MKYHHTIIIIALLLVAALVTAPAVALKVEGAKIMLDVKPGTNYIFPMAVSISSEDTASEYAIDILGFGQSLDAGSYQGLQPGEDTGPYSARSLVSLPSLTVHLQPGERKEFNATIRVPSNVGDGGRYAVILIHPAVTGTGQAAFATAVLVPVLLTVEGSKLVETGEITSVSVGEVVAQKPITVATVLRNTGNHHYYGAVNRLTVTDAAGRQAATATSEPFPRAVIPGQSVRFETGINTGLPIGTYMVKSTMTLQDGTVLDEESSSFTVQEEYIPPFEEASVTVSAESAAVLATPGGEITVRFPQGAFLAGGTVSVVPYRDDLPPLPAGVKAVSTVFSVDGVMGLLAKDATVSVRYSDADLKAAGNSAQKLALARYDRSDSAWTVLPTTVDYGARTLTATTNRFSTWAVVMTGTGTGAAAAGEAEPSGIPGFGAEVALGALGVLIVSFRRARRD
jgi:hypothetical protein